LISWPQKRAFSEFSEGVTDDLSAVVDAGAERRPQAFAKPTKIRQLAVLPQEGMLFGPVVRGSNNLAVIIDGYGFILLKAACDQCSKIGHLAIPPKERSFTNP
jgi:hypothetical protein